MSDSGVIGSMALDFDQEWSVSEPAPAIRRPRPRLRPNETGTWTIPSEAMLDADAWPFFTSEPAVLKKFMARNGLEKIVVEVSSAVAKHFDNVPPSVRVVSDPEEGSDHVSIRLPTSMAVDVAYRRFEDFLEQFWVDKHCDAVVVDLEFV